MLKILLSVTAALMLLSLVVSAEPGGACGGIVGDDVCGEGEYCAKATGSCVAHQAGSCTANDGNCTDDVTPVCGCDGYTYNNVCVAASVGINVMHEGACEAQAMACGGIAGIQCPNGKYCNFGSQCGVGDQQGACETVPEACTMQYDPVCGCDGKTYGNSCNAASAGVSVVSKGECSARKSAM